jgi:hypothetical protein
MYGRRGGWTRYVVTTLVNIGVFEVKVVTSPVTGRCLSRYLRRTAPKAARAKVEGSGIGVWILKVWSPTRFGAGVVPPPSAWDMHRLPNMKIPFKLNRCRSACNGALAPILTAASAFGQIGQADLHGFDKRIPLPPHAITLGAERLSAATDLLRRSPDLQIDYDDITGAPTWIGSASAFLSGPENEHEMVPQTIGAGVSPPHQDPYQAIEAFLIRNAALFEHGPEVLTNSLVVREFTTPHNGMRTIAWQQQVDGIPVFGAFFIGHITRRGELVSISSRFLPQAETVTGSDA